MAPRTQVHLLYENPDTSHQTDLLPSAGYYYFHEAIRRVKVRDRGRYDAAFVARLQRWLEWHDRKHGLVRDKLTVYKTTCCGDCKLYRPWHEDRTIGVCAGGENVGTVMALGRIPAMCPQRKGPVVCELDEVVK